LKNTPNAFTLLRVLAAIHEKGATLTNHLAGPAGEVCSIHPDVFFKVKYCRNLLEDQYIQVLLVVKFFVGLVQLGTTSLFTRHNIHWNHGAEQKSSHLPTIIW